MTEPPTSGAKSSARAAETPIGSARHATMSPGTASTHVGAARRACRAPTAIHPTRIIRRARRGASSATTAWTRTDDASTDPHAPTRPSALTDEQCRIILGLLVTMIILLGLITAILLALAWEYL